MQNSEQVQSSLNLRLTEAAQSKILEALRGQADKNAIRVEARATGTPEFQYAMRLITVEERRDDDFVEELEEFQLLVDPESARNLEGATIDYEDRIVRSGFKFDNPNQPEVPAIGTGSRPDLTGPVSEQVQMLLDSEINPAVAAHGGQVNLVGVKDNRVYLTFGGGCHGCGMVDVTLKQGVEARIREVIPEIQEVIDTTDHSDGENPYYA